MKWYTLFKAKLRERLNIIMTNIKKTLFRFIAILTILLVFCSSVPEVYASFTPEMSVHVIYLKSKKGKNGEGDAVLIQSKNNFLLMDTGMGAYKYSSDKRDRINSTSPSVISYLKKVGAGKSKSRPLDIYISHVHKDHYGGLWDIVRNKKIKVRNVYLPHKSLGNKTRNRNYLYHMAKLLKKSHKIKIKYLSPYKKKGAKTSIKCGDANIKIIGPVKAYTTKKKTAKRIEDAENNNSLCAMVTCGNFKFLTMGDALKRSERDLVAKYKDKLQASLVKQNHHGQVDANYEGFIHTVKPQRSFACSPKTKPSSIVVDRNYVLYGESMYTGAIKHAVVYQYVEQTGIVERSLCAHDSSQKIFRKSPTSSEKYHNLSILCPTCSATNTVTEKEGHFWNADGQCKYCGFDCPHKEYNFGINKCRNCNYKCKHGVAGDPYKYIRKSGSCQVCHYICPHGSWRDGRCTKCDFTCTHYKIDPETNQYYKKNGAYVPAWSLATGRCTICGESV